MTQPAANQAGPIFIVGYIHTGTSLLKTILRGDPNVFANNGETHFFQDLNWVKATFSNLGDPAGLRDYTLFLVKLAYLGTRRAKWQRDEFSLADLGLTDDQFETVYEAARAAVPGLGENAHAGLFPVVMAQLTVLNGKQRWLEKTPEHIYFLPLLLRTVQDAKVINLVRDPRAALASRKSRRTDEWLDSKEEHESVGTDRVTNFDPLIDSYLWKEAINCGKDAAKAFPGRVLTIRYEDMVGEPEQTLRQVCDYTGLPFRPEMLQVGWVNTTSRTAENASDKISKAAVERWRQTLTPDEVNVIQWALRGEMAEYRYEPMQVSLGDKAKAPVVLAGSAVHLVGRVAGRRPEGLDHRRSDTSGRVYRRVRKSLGLQK